MKTSRPPVRVLIVAASMDILGGQAVQAVRLMDHLKQEPAVEVDFLPVNPRLPGVLRKLQSIKYVRTVTTSIFYWFRLFRTVPQFDVLHVFSASNFSFLLAPSPAILVGKLFRKRIILNYHSGQAENHLRQWPRTSIPMMKMADEIIVPSPFLVRVFEKFDLHSIAIFNVVDFDQFTFRERSDLRPVFLSNRNFERHYGVDVVLKAFKIIQERFPDAILKVAGDGPCREELHRLAAELRVRNVEFLGAVEQQRMPALYNETDFFLNGSTVDNQPLSILEAYSCGVPVITTDAGGIPDMVTNGVTGMLVKMNDHEALGRAAIHLLEHPAVAKRMISEARKECERYRWPVVRSQWLDAYANHTLHQ